MSILSSPLVVEGILPFVLVFVLIFAALKKARAEFFVFSSMIPNNWIVDENAHLYNNFCDNFSK